MFSLFLCCSLSTQARRPQITTDVAANTVQCDICQALISRVEEALKDKQTEEQIAKYVSQYCTILGDKMKPFCESITTQYLPIILQFLENKMEKLEICQKIGFCSENSVTYLPEYVSLTKGGCEMCTTIVTKIEDLLKNGAVEKEIAGAVSLLCNKFPFPVSTLCGVIVNKYIPVIIQWIESGVEKIDICQKLGFCEKTNEIPDNGISCTMCKKVVEEVERLLLNKKVESEIIEALSNLCKKFPAPYDGLCTNFVQSYTVQILQLIEQGIEKIEICKKFGYCAAANAIVDQSNAMGCTMCTTIVEQIEKAMVSTKVESEIVELVKKLCGKLPAPYSTLCDSLVQQYVPVIMQWLEQGLEHIEICKKLGFCPKENVLARFQSSADGMACTICTSIVAQIEKVMVSTKVEGEVIELVKKLCAKFPAPYSTLCDSLVQQYVPQIMQWLEQGLEHIEVCQKIKLCPTTQTFLGARIPTEYQNGITCDVCKDFFQWATKELQKVSIDTLWYLVNAECPKVPYLKYFCKVINEQNIETIVNLILSKIPTDKACEFIRIC
jgi:saposin